MSPTKISIKGKIFTLFVLTIVVVLGGLYWKTYQSRLEKMELYNSALDQISQGCYDEAISILKPLGMFQDATRYITYSEAMLLIEEEKYPDARELLSQLGDFNESDQLLTEIDHYITELNEKDPLYQAATLLYNEKKYHEALVIFQQLGEYKDSQNYASICNIILNRLMQSNTISAGIQFSAGITQNGTVVFSGKNFDGISEIEEWTDIVSISANNEIFMGLKSDGTVVTSKREADYKYRIDTSDWSNIIAISAGEQYVVGLRANGTLTAQGIDGYGETDIDSWKDIVCIDTGWQHTVGLDKHGTIYITGFNSEKLLAEIHEQQDQWNDIISIATGGSTGYGNAGRGHVVALKRDGTVVAVGDNEFGQCNVGNWHDIIAISAGDYHTVGLQKDGTVVTTQTIESFPDSYSEITRWNNMVSISAGYGFTIGLQEDGTVKSAGLNKDGQGNVSDWTNIIHRDEWLLLLENNSPE